MTQQLKPTQESTENRYRAALLAIQMDAEQAIYAADFNDPCGGSIDVRLRESLETTKWDLHLSCRDIGEAIKAYNEL